MLLSPLKNLMVFMAASVSLSYPTAAQPFLDYNSQEKTSYLNRCIEDLSPHKITDFKKKQSQWNTLSIICTVAFITLAAGVFVAVNAVSLSYAPLVLMSLIPLTPLAAKQVLKFREYSSAAKEEMEKRQVIQNHYTELSSRSPQELQQILLNKRIVWGSTPDMRIQDLTPLIAKAQYLEDETTRWMNLKDRYTVEARLHSTATPLEKKVKEQAQYQALSCEDKALRYKIHQAFVHAVLRQPAFCGTLADVGILSENGYKERILGHALEDPSTYSMLTFHRPNLTPISFNDVKTLSVEDLSEKIFRAMTF